MGSTAASRIRRHVENLNSPDPDISSRAEQCLITYYGVRAFEPLIQACRHPNPVVRFRAAWALAYTHDPRAYETILALTRDPDERVRYDATIALGILGDLRAIEPLIGLLQELDDPQPAGMGLVRMGVAARPAVERVLHIGSAALRNTAVNILADYAEDGDARSLELVRESLNDLDPGVRADAMFWMEELESGKRIRPR